MSGRRVDIVAASHPHAVTLLAAARRAEPYHITGWGVPPETAFAIAYDGDRPVVGAAIRHESDGLTTATRWCVVRGAEPSHGAALLDALEAAASRAHSTRVRLDSTVFLAGAVVPWEERGYVVGPPYDGDADVSTWAERSIPPGA